MQVFAASAAQAGSPPGAYLSNVEALFRCLWVTAGSEDTQQEQKKSEADTEEEEEPDCD
jgi:hypothetical protein